MVASASNSSTGGVASSSKLPACGFSVTGGKKGNLPISVEKRPKGKKVTVISNVQGSARSLLSALSSLLGCGGTLRQEASGQHWTLEIQGDQAERARAALVQLGCLRGVKKEPEERQKKKQVVEVGRNCGYDKFLRRGDGDKKEDSSSRFQANADSISAAYDTCQLIQADCTKWHGAWVYCRGNCVQVNFDDIWEERLDGRDDEAGGSSGSSSWSASTSDLNSSLRALGMLSEVGSAAVREAPRGPPKNPASVGMTFTDYRRAALNPGARFIDEDTSARPKRVTAAERRAASRARSMHRRDEPSGGVKRSAPSAPSRPAPPPPKEGHFECLICGCVFGVSRTLRLHMRNAHNGAPMPSQQSRRVAPPRFNHAGTSSLSSTGWRRPKMDPWGARSKEDVTVCGPMWDRGEMVAPTKKPSQSCSLAAALGTKVTKAKQSKQNNRSAELRTCPICNDVFTAFTIEAHASNCRGPPADLADAGNLSARFAEESSEEEELNVRWRQSFAPKEAPTAEHEATSSSEDAACKLQDLRESGSANPTLVRPGDYCRICTSYSPTGEGHEVQMRVEKGQEVFVEWREEGTSGFWAWGAQRAQLAEPNQWGYFPLSCLGPAEQRETGSSDDWVNILPESSREKSASEPEDEEPRQAGSLRSSDDIPEEWLETFLMLELSEELATEFWDSFERFRKEMSVEAAWLQALETACSTAAEPTASPTADGAKAPLQDAKQREPEMAASEVEVEVMTVHKSWQPHGEGSNVQLRISVGDRLIITWKQPKEESGFWAFGYPEGQPGKAGYFPMQNLSASSSEPSRVVGKTVQSTATQEDSMNASRQTSTGARTSAEVHHEESKSTSARSAGGWRGSRRRQAASTAGTEPEAAAALQPKLQQQAQALQQAGQEQLVEESLEEWARPVEAWASCSQRKDAVLSNSDTQVSRETQRWAEQKIGDLCRRCCISQFDVAVAVSTLCLCTTAAETRSEAVALIADNQLVKNFASELWKRRCAAVH